MTCLYSDVDGRIVDIDRTTAAALGWKRDDVLNTLLVDHVHPDTMIEFERTWPDLVATDGATRSVSVRLRRTDGSWAPVTLDDTNLLDDTSFQSVQSTITFGEPAQTNGASAKLAPPPLVPAPLPEPLAVDGAYVRKNHVSTEVGWRERLTLAAIVLVALLVRAWDIGSLPISLHGDEAISGLDAMRILEEGWIGVYTPSALGQPAGPFYITALSVAVLGKSMLALRIVSTIAGALTVYAVFRIATPRFGVRVGLIAAGVLAVLNWHVHFTRLAFGVAWWPLITLLAVGAIDRARRRDVERRATTMAGLRIEWAFAGFCTAFGVYIYNAHWSVVGTLVVAVTVLTLFGSADDGVTGGLGRLGTFAGAAIITLVPMLTYILGGNDYSNHFQQYSLRSTPEWLSASFFGKAELIGRGYLTSWSRILVRPEVDLVDGSGILRPVPIVFGLAFLLGAVVLVLRHRHALAGLIVVMCLALPLGPTMTVDAVIRRDVSMSRRSWLMRTAVVAGLLVVVGGLATWQYFDSYRSDTRHVWTFSGELVGPIEAMNDHGMDAEVNLYSRRHSIGYETIQFMAPDVVGRDRLAPFVEDENIEPHPDANGAQLFILIGPETTLVAPLRDRYPDGTMVAEGASSGIPYRAFLVE